MRIRALLALGALLALSASLVGCGNPSVAGADDWALNATIIEACSCPMFCPCYFNPKPAAHAGHGEGHGGDHFCRFNMAFHVNEGHHGETDLAGVRFWIGGDLGGDFTKGMDWAVLHFDPAVTPEQRGVIQTALGHLFPVEWKSFSVGEDAAVEWTASVDRAEAKLAGGKMGHVILNRVPGMTDEPVVISNLRWWGAPRHDGFVLMPNEVEAYRAGDKPFEFGGGNGFMITIDINSDDV